MNKREAAIVSAYTGILIGEFSELHKYIEEVMGRPVFTHEMGSAFFSEELMSHAKDDFISIPVIDECKP